MLTLLASGAKTESGTSAVPDAIARTLCAAKRAVFLLELTAAATEVGDTLDVFIQSSVDGSIWSDFVRFTQMLGNGGAKKFEARWTSEVAPTVAQGAPTDGSMSAGVNQGAIGPNLRVKWGITDASTTNASFTFSLKAQAYK